MKNLNKIQVHIRNLECYMDDNVSIEILLPHTPQVDDKLVLTDKQKESLISQISAKRLKTDYKRIVYGTGPSIDDCTRVGSRMFNMKDNTFHIEMEPF